MKVAIIDDSQFMRGLIVKALKTLHPEATLFDFENPEKALAELPKLQPDLITLDLLMPHLNGFEFLDQLAKTSLRPRILVITADVQKAVRQRCAEAGVHAFVEKPVTLEKLRAALLEVLPR